MAALIEGHGVGAGDAGAKSSIVGDMVAVYREGGLRSVYRGLGPQLLAALPATCGMYVGERSFARFFQLPDGLSSLVYSLHLLPCLCLRLCLCLCL